VTEKTSKKERSVDQQVAHAINHPVRIDALAVFNERTASPSEIAKEAGKGVSQVGFHIHELLATGCIELVDTRPVRGAVEHFYRATLRPRISDEEWQAMPDDARLKIVALVFQAIVAEGLAALRAGKMEGDDDLHMAWRVMNLDEQGRRELAEEQAESLSRAEGIEARSANRLAEADATGTSTIVAAMGFDRSRQGRPCGDSLATPEG
jgi:hypothetical protein